MSITTRNFARITKTNLRKRLNKKNNKKQKNLARIQRSLSCHSLVPFRKGQVLLFFFVSSL